MFRFLPMVMKNAWRNRRRTSLTVVSIGVSLCLLGVLLAIYHAFYFSDPPPEQAMRLVTRNRVSLAFPMPQSYREKIRLIPGVREVGISQWFGGVYKDRRDPQNMFARFAVEPALWFRIRTELKVPEEQKAAFIRERTACMVGRPLADRLGLKLGDRVTLEGDIFPVNMELTVRAIYDAPENNESLYFNREYLEESLPVGRRGSAGTFNILAETPESVPAVAQAVDQAFRNSTVETKTESEQAFQLSFISMLGNVKMFLLSICAAVTFTIMLVSANTIAMSVRERIREVGVLKTLGFTRGMVLGIILAESVAISIFGGLLGWVLARGLVGVVRQAPLFISQLRTLSVPFSVALACVGIALAIGFVSALVPAWNAARTPIVEALRSSD